VSFIGRPRPSQPERPTAMPSRQRSCELDTVPKKIAVHVVDRCEVAHIGEKQPHPNHVFEGPPLGREDRSNRVAYAHHLRSNVGAQQSLLCDLPAHKEQLASRYKDDRRQRKLAADLRCVGVSHEPKLVSDALMASCICAGQPCKHARSAWRRRGQKPAGLFRARIVMRYSGFATMHGCISPRHGLPGSRHGRAYAQPT
jgi:hypothetical protein